MRIHPNTVFGLGAAVVVAGVAVLTAGTIATSEDFQKACDNHNALSETAEPAAQEKSSAFAPFAFLCSPGK